MAKPPPVTILPATAERWPDFADLMGKQGGYGGCWCMDWRLLRPEFRAQAGDGNRRAMKRLFEGAEAPGLLAYDGGAYDGGQAVGWCSLARRSAFPRLARSRVLQPVDDAEVWSISCFLIRKTHRRRGVSTALIQAACDLVRSRGGGILEGYPIDPKKTPYPAPYAWTGLASAFRRAGFKEVLRRSDTRPIMRKRVRAASRKAGG